MLPYGFFITLAAVYRKPSLRNHTILVLKSIIIRVILVSIAIAGLTSIFIKLHLPLIVVIVPLFAIFLIKRYSHWLALGVFIAGEYLDFSGTFQYALAVMAPLFIAYIIIQFYFMSRNKVLKNEISISELKEGMIPESSVYIDKDRIVNKPPLGMKKVIKYLRANDLAALQKELQPKGKILVDSRRAAGVDEEQVVKLKELAAQGKIPGTIVVKSTAPLVPAILIAYIITQLLGDLLWNLIF